MHNKFSSRRRITRASSNKDVSPSLGKSTGINEPKNLGLKAAWHIAEAFGKLVGTSAVPEAVHLTDEYISREKAIQCIKEDYELNYFVSGQGDLNCYHKECIFADPFASFTGVDRFKRNVGNLGSLLTNVNLEILEWNELEEEIHTKWRFSATLGLPWSPILAAAGGTRHIFCPESGKVIKHIESWDVDPLKVLLSLFKAGKSTK